MIVYKDILDKLKDAGYSTYKIRKERCMTEATLTSIRNGRAINTDTIDKLCYMLQCQPGDILEYQEPANKENKNKPREEVPTHGAKKPINHRPYKAVQK